MHIGVPAETVSGETRVAATADSIKKLVAAGHQVHVQSGAGVLASIPDSAYVQAGAQIVDVKQAWACELVLKVRAPQAHELPLIQAQSALVGMLNPFDQEALQALAATGVTAFALECAPRTTRAQSMDVLSSQANIAGYKAVMLAANAYTRFMPMLMTAAGTVKAARVLILGVGVAGLQAIATAKRLGAVIEATDVRPATKEQVESLGAKFVDVPFETERETAQGVGGYARPMPESWLARQRTEVAKRVAQADIVITTALIPGRTAPTLLSEEMLSSMKPGSVVVDMAAGRGALNAQGLRGGNCPLTLTDQSIVVHGVTLIGHSNLPALVAADASAFYARNLLDFLKLIIGPEGHLHYDMADDIVSACLVTQGGSVNHNTKPGG
jgi:NAD(P) transhydrogenase subunit alpha